MIAKRVTIIATISFITDRLVIKPSIVVFLTTEDVEFFDLIAPLREVCTFRANNTVCVVVDEQIVLLAATLLPLLLLLLDRLHDLRFLTRRNLWAKLF